ncbi:tRNA (adenosine(37)-N6)-threonylcarbamoyltransferase complex dimerization subunit type 1 TsaB [Erythrobacter sp. SD-21]|uniref:tRNA (adenosine(37)-N6)-threonylcarbamoyltransferase complex dimerization subunit type 1 TsaB n=1 Tax=Erythrobacter sp. SD-21 TaxID=161528 RepID=UPI000153FAB0|nr:tRNA (adenosine(37)-N6)-threonylcarbamoyltransferase complex dimerization subunit type 1 TsaB [Erythrobacter sp. SD-21]EDL48138.1 metal-dependent protease [Erythrobacter sp. SD-21]
MRVLTIETATEACSVALFEGSELVDAHHEVLGRGHAERLVPMVERLPGKGRADQIRVSLGPGSFTGVRIGLAVARALGLAWQSEVRGYPTLALVAAIAKDCHASGDVTVCMNGGHGQWFVQNYEADGLPQGDAASLVPDEAATGHVHPLIAGNRAQELAGLITSSPHDALDTLPDARHVLHLSEKLLTADLSPIYGRAPDAKLPA